VSSDINNNTIHLLKLTNRN